MKIVIPGGSGQVGKLLARSFVADGHEVVVLSRRPVEAIGRKVVAWDAKTLGPWTTELEAVDAVINLAGRNVDCRYNSRNRQLIMDSRVRSTQVLGEAIAKAVSPPRVWLQASTATIYAHSFDFPNGEENGVIDLGEKTAPSSWQFSIEVATAWEAAAKLYELPKTRQVLLRSAMTMSPDRGGIFDVLLGLVRRGLGGTCGNGRQYVSWIHEQDFVRAVYWLMENEMTGPVNLAAPCPLPNREFMQSIRETWGTKIGLPASRWMLEVGALFLRTETELILKSRRVVPTRLLEAGFGFNHPKWPAAAADLCRRWRAEASIQST